MCDTDREMACSACRLVRRRRSSSPASEGAGPFLSLQQVTAGKMHPEGEREKDGLLKLDFVLRNDSIMNWMKFIKFILVLQLSLGNLNFVAAKRTRLCE